MTKIDKRWAGNNKKYTTNYLLILIKLIVISQVILCGKNLRKTKTHNTKYIIL